MYTTVVPIALVSKHSKSCHHEEDIFLALQRKGRGQQQRRIGSSAHQKVRRENRKASRETSMSEAQKSRLRTNKA